MTEIEVLDKAILLLLEERSTFCCPTFAYVCFGDEAGRPQPARQHPNWPIYESVMNRFTIMFKPPRATPDEPWWPGYPVGPRITALRQCRDYFATKYHEQTEAQG
jgi:hypothetical protein